MAEAADRLRRPLKGIYQVVSSSDPLFSLRDEQEYFLDFGEGMTSGKLSGSVAVSLRRNPHVKVRIMAWQYFPKEGSLVMGNLYHEGSNQALAAAIWQLSSTSKEVDLKRDGYQVTLRRAESP